VLLVQQLLVDPIQLLKILNTADVLGSLHLLAHNPLVHSLDLHFVLFRLRLGHFQQFFPHKVLRLIHQFSFQSPFSILLLNPFIKTKLAILWLSLSKERDTAHHFVGGRTSFRV